MDTSDSMDEVSGFIPFLSRYFFAWNYFLLFNSSSGLSCSQVLPFLFSQIFDSS